MTDPTPSDRCPICHRPSTAKDRPFCSARCADLDLHRWLVEGYRIPGEEAVEDSDPEGLDPP